jgi:lysozyme
MHTFNLIKLKAELNRDEGRRAKPYKDSEGIWTVGIGWNLQARGLPPGAYFLLPNGDKTGPREWLSPVECIAQAEQGFTLTEESIDKLFDLSVADAEADARVLFPSFESLSDARQRVLVNMAFNMGRQRLGGFRRMRAAIDRGDFDGACAEMIDSDWWREFERLGSKRARRLVAMMREG